MWLGGQRQTFVWPLEGLFNSRPQISVTIGNPAFFHSIRAAPVSLSSFLIVFDPLSWLEAD